MIVYKTSYGFVVASEKNDVATALAAYGVDNETAHREAVNATSRLPEEHITIRISSDPVDDGRAKIPGTKLLVSSPCPSSATHRIGNTIKMTAKARDWAAWCIALHPTVGKQRLLGRSIEDAAYVCGDPNCPDFVPHEHADSESHDDWWHDSYFDDAVFCVVHRPNQDEADALWKRREDWEERRNAAQKVFDKAWTTRNTFPIWGSLQSGGKPTPPEEETLESVRAERDALQARLDALATPPEASMRMCVDLANLVRNLKDSVQEKVDLLEYVFADDRREPLDLLDQSPMMANTGEFAMLECLAGNLEELRKRWRAGELEVVNEFLEIWKTYPAKKAS